MKKLLLAASVAALGFVAAPNAMAQAAPGGNGDQTQTCTTSPCEDVDMNVHVGISGNCSRIEVADLEFGTYQQLTGNAGTTNRDAQTTVDVLCVTGAPYTVGLNYGINSTSNTQRQVRDSGANLINYYLYKDAGRTQPWGLAANEPGSEVGGTGTGQFQTLTIYGRLQQTTGNPTGDYTDLVTAVLNFQ